MHAIYNAFVTFFFTLFFHVFFHTLLPTPVYTPSATQTSTTASYTARVLFCPLSFSYVGLDLPHYMQSVPLNKSACIGERCARRAISILIIGGMCSELEMHSHPTFAPHIIQILHAAAPHKSQHMDAVLVIEGG